MTDRVVSSGDQARVSVLVAASAAEAFRVFTEEIDQWWRRDRRFRVAGAERSVVRLEPRVGGRLCETWDSGGGARIVEIGRVSVWEPPARLELEWRPSNFAPSEKTDVEVTFEPQGDGTRVTVTHRGWSSIRADHPARHGHDVGAFLRMTGLWWGELMTSMREHAAGGESGVT